MLAGFFTAEVFVLVLGMAGGFTSGKLSTVFAVLSGFLAGVTAGFFHDFGDLVLVFIGGLLLAVVGYSIGILLKRLLTE